MYAVTNEYKKAMKEQVQRYTLKGTIGETAITDANIQKGSLSIVKQCSDEQQITIGSVYVSELKAVFVNVNIDRYAWKEKEITLWQGLLIGDGEYEYVPLGIYRISEAVYSKEGVSVTAYDRMSLFDKTVKLSVTSGTPYELLAYACENCGVPFGMIREDVEKYANGTTTLSLYTKNDIETWRDFLYWISQTLGTFATMSRDGKLVLVSYSNTEVDRVDSQHRFIGAGFSDYETYYTGIYLTNADDNTMTYYGIEDDTGLTLSLGENPFIQYGVTEYKEKLCKEILESLAPIRYVPYQTEMLPSAVVYDLGDVICFSEGIADENKLYCINKINYTFNKSCELVGVGKNPALASAKSKTDKNLEGLRSNASSSDIIFFNYENASAVTVKDGETKTIIDIRFTSSKKIGVLFQAEILLSSNPDAEDVIGEIAYELNGTAIMGYTPTETWKNGKHILSLMYMLMIEENTINRWVAKLKVSGGMVTINPGGIRAVVYGQGLVGTVEWDGYITIEEKLAVIAMSKSIAVDKHITEEVFANMLEIDTSTYYDNLPLVFMNQSTQINKMAEQLDIRWQIKSWTFVTDSEATYASRYVDIVDDSYKLATIFVNESENVVIDSGKMNVVCVDSTEFAAITEVVISPDETPVRYLIRSEEIWYTVEDGVLTALDIAEDITAKDFAQYGIYTEPPSALLVGMASPEIYKWTDEDSIKDTIATITALPHQQTIQAECDMSDVSIYGIVNVAAVYMGAVKVCMSYDGGLQFTDEELLADALEGNLLQVYNKLNENKKLTIVFILSEESDSLTQFQYCFNNEEVEK